MSVNHFIHGSVVNLQDFFILINISSLRILNDNTFRFVPCPPNNSFDHLYTDEELYDWFNLPEEYRVVIDSILRDHK